MRFIWKRGNEVRRVLRLSLSVARPAETAAGFRVAFLSNSSILRACGDS